MLANGVVFYAKEYGSVSFSSEEEKLICSSISGDVLAKVELVKSCIDIVLRSARWYSMETGKPISQNIQTGILAVVKAAETFHHSQHIKFIDYVSQEVIKAMAQDP